jgi:hypothetical protein
MWRTSMGQSLGIVAESFIPTEFNTLALTEHGRRHFFHRSPLAGDDPVNMTSRTTVFRIFSAVIVASGIVATRHAQAETPKSDASVQPSEAPLGLVVFGELPADSLREALAKRLKRPIVLRAEGAPHEGARVTVTYRRSELGVTYDEPGRGTLSRVVPARNTIPDVVDDAAQLAEALVRNEADELLGTREARPSNATEAAVGIEPTSSGEPAPPPKRLGAYASLVHPLATNFNEPYASVKFGAGLCGRAGELDNGLQLGVVNVLSGGEGHASGRMRGLQLAWLANIATGRADGLQLAWANVAGSGIAGGQLALIGNVSAGDVDGLQLSLAGNVATARLRGGQIGAVNIAGDTVGGQAGLVNVAGNVVGSQLGLVNVSKELKGLTVGLINIADDIDGVPIGLVSVTKEGGIHPVAWSSSATFANVGVKFATRYTYTMISAEYTHDGERLFPAQGTIPERMLAGMDFVGGGFFLGAHVPFGRAYADLDISGSPLVSTTKSPRFSNPDRRDVELIVDTRARAMVGLSLWSHLSVFVGGGAVVRTRLVENNDGAAWWLMPEIFGGVQF